MYNVYRKPSRKGVFIPLRVLLRLCRNCRNRKCRKINPSDLRIDTYRASGAGGQHINKTDSAVRITHIPTGIVTQSQAQRSQFKNRDQANGDVEGEIVPIEEEKKAAELAAIRGEQKASPGVLKFVTMYSILIQW